MTLTDGNDRVSGMIEMGVPPDHTITIRNYSQPRCHPNFELIIRASCDKSMLYNGVNKPVADIKKRRKMLSVDFLEPLTPAEKSLVLVFLMRRQFWYDKYQWYNLIPTFDHMPPIYVPVVPKHLPTLTLPREELVNVITDSTKYYIRPSNYCPQSDTYYLDIMTGTEKHKQVFNNVKLECGVDGGKLQWVNNSNLCFVARGVLSGEAMQVTDAFKDPLSFSVGEKIFTNSGKFAATASDPTVLEDGRFTEGLILQGNKSDIKLARSREGTGCVLMVWIARNVWPEVRVFAFAWAIRNYFNVYKLHDVPIPLIQEVSTAPQ